MLSWAKSFRERRTCVENEPHTGRPRTSVNPDNVLKIVSKVSARWVPRLLTTEHRERRLVAVTQLLQHYKREGAQFLDSVVTSDETWVHYFTSESKRANKQWKPFHSPPSKKSENNFSSGDDHCYCVLGFKGRPSPGLPHWPKNHQCTVLLNSLE
ncbi:hypothetical protein Cfor_00280 [Coptotermes formosanus]|uniref:Histone-lysine N-methyltransferase SETMAR n=1 Tax=Coptotermes formosanus TaxID=36987 RepID=A0A6L2P9T1_COPFO|nr:hypothetical protein Cfor_00280 [Coptotermes formosanus]